MSNWTTPFIVSGSRFIAHVDCKPFDVAESSDTVDDVVILDAGDDREMALATWSELKRSFVGKPLSDLTEHLKRIIPE